MEGVHGSPRTWRLLVLFILPLLAGLALSKSLEALFSTA